MNEIYNIIVNKNKAAMYLNVDNKCAGYDDFDIAVQSGRPFCCDMLPEVIPVDIDKAQLPYLTQFREIIQESAYPYLEIMSGGENSPNRHFYILVTDTWQREILVNDLRSICGSVPVRIGQKIRPPFTPHRSKTGHATPVDATQVEAFINASERLLV